MQAATGLLAVAVLLVVMNWFFHWVYWTGWIGTAQAQAQGPLAGGLRPRRRCWAALLGFTGVYREGFEIVLFLQNLRLSGAGWSSRASRSASL